MFFRSFIHSPCGVLCKGLEYVGSEADGTPAHWSLQSIGERKVLNQRSPHIQDAIRGHIGQGEHVTRGPCLGHGGEDPRTGPPKEREVPGGRPARAEGMLPYGDSDTGRTSTGAGGQGER